ncbi:hypothetical protein KEM54_005487 [Ascosphaera aggregata]|nr:hypothetical protein KEM54_005487 [Ascosphaera aggregata]
MTGVSAEGIKQKLQSQLEGVEHVQIVDTSGGCGQSFAALIVSDASFQGKSLLARHRLVNGILRDEIKEIHAWTPRCLTVEQWVKEGRS